jgi:hypothetical protein
MGRDQSSVVYNNHRGCVIANGMLVNIKPVSMVIAEVMVMKETVKESAISLKMIMGERARSLIKLVLITM